MNRLLYVLTVQVLSFLFLLSCSVKEQESEEEFHPEWAELNMGDKFDSLKYEDFRGMLGCDGTHDHLYRIPQCHHCYCPNDGYIQYKKLDYYDKPLSYVLEREGEPDYRRKDTLYYGYRKGFPMDNRGDVIFGIHYFYFADGIILMENPEFYRVSRILNRPKCIVQNLEWTNDERFLGIYCLETASDTIVIYGFQSIPNFYRTWIY